MKKKLLIKALGYVLSAAMLFGSVPVPVMAAEQESQSEVSVIEETDTEEGADIEAEVAEEEYPLASELELLDLDWKNASDETLNHYLGMTDWAKIGMWLDAFSEEDLNEILARDTVLVLPTYVTEEDGDQVEMTYYKYALKVYEECKGMEYAYPLQTSGYWTVKIVQLNAAGTAVQTCTLTNKITGVDTSVATSNRQSITVAKTVANNWCGLTFNNASESFSTFRSEGDNIYSYARSNFSYTKPAGYTASVAYSNTTALYKLYWNHQDTFRTSASMFNDGVFSDDRHEYSANVTCNGVSTANIIASSYTGTHNIVSCINMYINAGIGTTVNATKGNMVQTITLSPITYNVTYNGNGSTSGSVAAQNCAYGQAYTTQTNGFTRDYTVTYNGNGGIASVASQTANYKFKGWGKNQTSTVNYAGGASFSNLTTTANGNVTMNALWTPASITLASATREGYQFSGWNIGAAGTAYTPTANVTAIAKWTPNKYKIVLDKSNGTEKETIDATYDQNVTLPTPEKTGYTFTGWVGEGGAYKGEVKNLTSVNGATVDLTASWAANTDTPYTVYYWKEDPLNPGTFLPFGDEGDLLPASEIMYGTTDTVVTVPAPNVEGYITPTSAMKQIAADGSLEIVFEYRLLDKDVTYYVEHYIKTSPSGEYKKLTSADEMLTAEEGSIITPPLSQKAIAAVNAVEGCYCKEPALQTVTLSEDGMIIKYYYDCVKKGTTGNGSISDYDINEIAKKLAAGLSFSMDIDGVTYEIIQNPDGTLGIKFITTDSSKVVIPDVIKIGDKIYRITEIHKKAFFNNKTLKELVLSANIQKIGDSAFQGCTSLEKVTFHEGLVTIGNYAFDGCTALKSITTPSTLQTIGDYAFQNCTSLAKVTLNDGLLTIGKKAFYNCTALTSITIPKTVLKIGSYAFAKCTKLKKVTFAPGSQLLTMGTGVFSNDKAMTKITLPDKLRNVPAKAFYNCTKLKTVKIGKAVTKIGKSAFRNCKKITKITVPSKVQTIGKFAFYNCKKLKTVTIKSKAITSVGKNAFKKCKKNIAFKVPNSKIASYSKLLKGKY